MTAILFVFYAVSLFLIARLMHKSVREFLLYHDVMEYNYKRLRIPSASGVLIWLVFFAGLLLQSVGFVVFLAFPLSAALQSQFLQLRELNVWFFTAITIVSGLGWTDDLLGNRAIQGLRGHLAAWFQQGVVTTGLLKAVGTILAACWLSVQAGLWDKWVWAGFMACLLMPLSTNAMNLLDLRPGRAIKIFLTGGLIVLAGCVSHKLDVATILLIPALVSVLVLLPSDLSGESMLGDTGANILGFVLGAALALTWTWQYQIAALLIVAGIHLLAETTSITQFIERVPMLRWLDRLGR